MGVIKEGTVSGNLPPKDAFVVHYPGYPSSTSRAIQMLGGTESILKARSLKSNKLELHFRPEDPYSHPTFGVLQPCNNFLLKISISKHKSCDGQSAESSSKILKDPLSEATTVGNGQEIGQPESEPVAAGKEVDGQTSEDDNVNLSADIVTRVSEAYCFDGMADYQHVVAIHADAARRKKRNWTEMEEPHDEKDGLMNPDEDDVMMMLPPFFAPKDKPTNLVLRPSVIPSSKKKEEGVVQNSPEMDIKSGLAIDFKVKEIPEKVNWEEFISRDSEQWEWQMAVSKLFDERPIWPKISLIDRLLDEGLKFNSLMLKRLLLGNAYYFSNGPFLRFWIRKGYDPRKDPESRIYQRIDYRVKPQLRSYCESDTAAKLKCRWKDLCAFQVFPTKCSTSFQLFELADDYIQQEIRKLTKETTCSLETGWFSRHALAIIRKRIEVRFLSVYPQPGAGNLLKSASERFAKLKKMSFYNDTLKPGQEEQQQVNKELTCDEDKEKAEIIDDDNEDKMEEDEEEEDRIEVDNSEDESDAEVGDNDEISLQSHPYPDWESNSKLYLQELFGSFPSNEVGFDDKLQDDISDGEFQTYEPDSDDGYSDEDAN